jgi:hypothetical protein
MGVETQRQWSDLAILRTTPALFGLLSLVTLLAHHLPTQQPFHLIFMSDFLHSLAKASSLLIICGSCLLIATSTTAVPA